MNVLESPLDALAFDYVSYGILIIVNNVWTWVAFVTAAVSFWRIRSAASGAASFSAKCDPPAPTSNSTQTSPAIPQIENPRVRTSVPSSTEAVRDFEVDGVTKGKFTVYYEDDGEHDGGLSGVREWEGKESEALCGEWWEGWESLLRTRRGEWSWYGYQDLTVINGNVVKLWDGGVWKEEYGTAYAVW